MNNGGIISVVLDLHKPFVRNSEPPPPETQPEIREERWFFEALSETYLPLLEVFDRLDADHIPFKIALSLSPTLCHMLQDEYLLERYLRYVDRQIDFGVRELERTGGSLGSPDGAMHQLAQAFYNQTVDKRVLFTERYGHKILKIFDYYQRKGRVELLTTAATHAFLPLYAGYPEACQAQFETAMASHRAFFGKNPHGFWLPELGWSPELDRYLRAYNFSYTIVDTHGLALTDLPASRGSWSPVKTPAGIFILARDFYACRELERTEGPPAPLACHMDPLYRDYHRDAGYELPAETVRPFLESSGARTRTGYKYWASGGTLYDPQQARERAEAAAVSFLNARIDRLSTAAAYLENPISLCAYNADLFGRFWYEGPAFLEALFREGARRGGGYFMNPAEYLYKQNADTFPLVCPEYSSWGVNGYGEMWLDASNDWLYRHVLRSLDRMVELAERFPNDTGIKERALNQAAREILLTQCSDWPEMLYKQENAAYARNQVVAALRNFTTIYEALGSSYISTEWLTNLERRHNCFPAINYRVFRHKQ
ncbi:glycoside hydrolase family protein [Spirochaetia bacterium]|nr:glycoside hydrolase family protein [Spirochaetia bacterium]